MRLEDFLDQHAEKRSFAAGHPLFVKGAQADAAYCIISGEVEITDGPPGAGALLARLGPGEIFGEMALLRFDSYTLSARAATDVQVFVITPGLLHEQVRQLHPLIKTILDMLVERVHSVNQVLIDLDKANKT